jgi:hypothetical protein
MTLASLLLGSGIALGEDASEAAAPLEVLCVAGCNRVPPHVVQRLPVPPVKAGEPLAAPRYVRVVDGLWCEAGGGCRGVGERPSAAYGLGVLAVFAFR